MRTDLSELTPSMIIIGTAILGSCCVATLSCFGIAALIYSRTRNRQVQPSQPQPIFMPDHKGSVENLIFPEFNRSGQSTLIMNSMFNSRENKALSRTLNRDQEHEHEFKQSRTSSLAQAQSLARSISLNPEGIPIIQDIAENDETTEFLMERLTILMNHSDIIKRKITEEYKLDDKLEKELTNTEKQISEIIKKLEDKSATQMSTTADTSFSVDVPPTLSFTP